MRRLLERVDDSLDTILMCIDLYMDCYESDMGRQLLDRYGCTTNAMGGRFAYDSTGRIYGIEARVLGQQDLYIVHNIVITNN